MTVEGALNAEALRSYVSGNLLPTLKTDDIVVMDNPSAHKDRQAFGLLKDAGVKVRFPPAYSPDLNPIELMWSKVKALLRKTEARTHEALLLAIGEALSRVTQKGRHPLACPLRGSIYLKCSQAGLSVYFVKVRKCNRLLINVLK